jgi:ABC-type enterochelin transport system substrate-binding protein
MKPVNFIFLIFTSLLLLACSPDNTPKTKLFEEQRNALDKAKAVDSTVQQQTQQLQQSEEKQTQ